MQLWLTLLGMTMCWYCCRPCLALQERTVVLLYNKPPHVVTSHAVDDVKGRRNVYQDVYSMQGWVRNQAVEEQSSSSSWPPSSFADATGITSRLHAVGRLDADTTGALLLTNDGGLVHHVTNRQAHGRTCGAQQHLVSKTYEAVIMGRYENDAEIFQQMRRQGVDIGQKYGGQTLPVDDLHVLDHPTPKSTTVQLTISEGKNRQVRRMFHSVGSGVMTLKRVSIGNGLDLGHLEEGEWRILSDKEVQTCLSYTPRFLEAPVPSSRPFTTTARKRRGTTGKPKQKRRKVRRSR